MNPRRLIPYAVVFLVLAGAYVALHWHRGQEAAREQQAKQVFQVQAQEMSDLSLVRGKEEIRLVKKNQEWDLQQPLASRADQTVVDQMVSTLAGLKKERDLGTAGDPKAFGLKQPSLVVSFTAKGRAHKLTFGNRAPGDRTYYALKDQGPEIILISAGSKDALDKTLTALRDKTLLSFVAQEVKSIKIRKDQTEVQLVKTGPQNWRWEGRPQFRVRGDRVEKLLRDLNAARIKEFPAAPPKGLRAAGLAPRPQTQVTVETPQGARTLLLGARKGQGVYARQGAAGPVVLVDPDLPGEIAKTVASLEDKRLWTGSIPGVHKMSWGPPGRTWVAVREKESWKLTGPQKAEVQQPAVRVEMALWNFQSLEYTALVSQGGAPSGGKPVYTAALWDDAGKSLCHLEDLGAKGNQQVEIRLRVGDKTFVALVPQKKFSEWQGELTRLTAPPPKK